MLRWSPSREWDGEDAYIIGGGTSLSRFDWGLLRGRNTIGCNSAFLLGAHIIKICIFGDYVWWQKIGRKGTEDYGGRVVGCAPKLDRAEPCPWLLTMDRSDKNGLDTKKLGFNGNTGSLALNLALILGAKRVFLLGFDMKLGPEGNPNWHTLRYEPGNSQSYTRFVSEFKSIVRDLPLLFSGCEVWNVTHDSDLHYFPKVTPEEHFGCVQALKEGIEQ